MLKLCQFVVFLTLSLVAVTWSSHAGLARGDPLMLKVIANGAAIHQANGMYFDSDDRLHVASATGREIVVLDPATGKILDRLGPEVGVEGPDDVTIGPDGSIYWTCLLCGYVGRRTPDGVTTTQFLAPGANPITFSDSGRLFVGLDFLGDALYELDPNLIEPPRPIIVPSVQNPYPLGFFNGFDFGPDGRLYGPLFAVGIVISIDVDSCENTSNPWIDCDIQVVAGGFIEPAAAKFDSQGRLHIVDRTGSVTRVDTASGEGTVIANVVRGLDNLAFDSTGNLYVSSYLDGSVTRILPSGKGRVISKGGIVAPGGVAIMPLPDGSESVFVADLSSLREFNGLTGQQQGLAEGAFLGGGLVWPSTVSADGEYLVVSSWFMAAVQVWDPATEQVLEHYTMPLPLNAIRFQDDLVVADPLLGGVVWASTGELILGQSHVVLPTGLVANEDTLWIADWYTGVVWQLGFNGSTPQTPIPVAFGLANPEGLAMDLDGSLLVVESGAGRLSRIDLVNGGTVTTVADGLEIGAPAIPVVTPPTWGFSGVAVGPSGAVYLTGEKANVLYRISPR